MKKGYYSLTTLFLLLFLAIQSVSAQQKANFELAERFTSDNVQKMIGSTSVFPRWIEDTNRFWYTYENSEGTFWWYVDAERGSKRPLFDRDELSMQLAEIFNKPFNAKDLDLDDFTYDDDKQLFTFNVEDIEFTYNINGNDLVKGDSVKEEENERWANYSPDSTYIVYAKNHNLYMMKSDTSDTTEYQLTEDGERWFSYQANAGDTTTNEKMRARARWFDNEKKIVASRSDDREVDELWVINTGGDRPSLETYKYAMPGEEEVGIEYVEVFDVETMERTILPLEKWEDQTLNAGYGDMQTGDYDPDGSDVMYIYRLNRKASMVDIIRYDAAENEMNLVFSDTSEPYLNWEWQQLEVIGDGDEYIWWSEETGWGHLYRYDSEGNLINQITRGPWQVGDIVKVDEDEETIFFEAYGREQGVHPYYAMLYKVNFDGSGLRLLTPEPANHSISESEEGNYFVDNYSTVDTEPVSVLRDENGRVITELERTDFSQAREAGWDTPEVFTVKAADGATDIYGVMWKPFDFDSTKSYPVVSYVYPGPQTEPFPIGFSYRGSSGRNASLAQLGFVVLAMGNRGGSPIRSKYYHTYGYGDLRDYPLADNKYGIEQLAARHSFVDASRVGIYGHSGGGFMSTAALLTYPGFYDVAVSSAGNHDNNVYNRWWSETHNGVKRKVSTVKEMADDSTEVEKEEITFDAPIETNAELAANLEGHLLLVHGNIDNNVHPANTLRLADALIKAGKRFDMMILPGRRHGFGEYQPYFDRMTWHYFAEHLLGDYRTNVEFNLPQD
ncbi:DPP IV N-terminal domain-containing protein [Balneola sp. MJW-20]|uniref:S9 family peptidase n=1 Tax=Gracilimonas aurantiaca TaxID=3234185 RepID=UPI0034650B33